MRTMPVLSGAYYHVYNRGSLKQILFYDEADYARFLFLLIYFQSPVSLTQTNRYVRSYLERRTFDVKEKYIQDIIEQRFVEVLNFCIMPNHFHLTVKSLTDDGLSKYMHRVSSAYATYFNKRHNKSGHVLQGAYKAKIILSDEQLMYLSAYIHRNSHELDMWKGRSNKYPWSSYQDYDHNRWGSLLETSTVNNTFKSFQDYREYVETSGAKEDWEEAEV
jgi:putative transposase